MAPRDPLDDLLDRWHPAPGEVPDLRAEVRRELARCQHSDGTPWLTRLEQAFSRPSFAFTFMAACVLLGLFLAEARVSRQHAIYGAQIARSYVQLIDPLLAAETEANAKGKAVR
jgi:hypothetical protein